LNRTVNGSVSRAVLSPANEYVGASPYIATEAGALVLRGQLRYSEPVHTASFPLAPDVATASGEAESKSGEWEVGSENIPDVLYQLRDHQAVLIIAPVSKANRFTSAAPAGLC
jgi:hypothetical protein